MNDVILHGFPVSANTHRVRLMLALLEVPFEERTVNLVAGEHLQARYSALNPHQRVPALEHGGYVLTESCAILIYLVETFAQDCDSWWPVTPGDRALVAAWLFFTVNDLHNGIGLARNERAFRIPSGGEYAVGRARKSLERLNAHLSSRRFLELDRPTLADIAVYPFVAVSIEAGLPISDWPALVRWNDELCKLPGFLPMPLLRAPNA